MTLSVVIAHWNEPMIRQVVESLYMDYADNMEVIISDDYSDSAIDVGLSHYPNLKIIYGGASKGVGSSLERGVAASSGEVVVLMGGDVFVPPEWRTNVLKNVSERPNQIGCSICRSTTPDEYPGLADNKIRYGATIHPVFIEQKEGPHYPKGFNIDLLTAEWITTQPSYAFITQNEVPCILGGFYFSTRHWLDKIGMWDKSHRYWGALEPWISIKSWLYGGGCYVASLETKHLFNKFKGESPHGRTDWMWYNKFFIPYTMMEEYEKNKLLCKTKILRENAQCFMHPYWLGLKYIRLEKDRVSFVRKRNFRNFTNDFKWFCDKFNIERIYESAREERSPKENTDEA